MLAFKSLRQSLADPEFLMSDFAKFDRPLQLHLGFQALHAFRAAHGELPAPSDAAHAAELLSLAKGMPGGGDVELEAGDDLRVSGGEVGAFAGVGLILKIAMFGQRR